MRHEELRGCRSDELGHVGVRLHGRVKQPSPLRPVLVHHRVLGESRLGLRRFETDDHARNDPGQLRGSVEGVFIV